MFRPFMVIIRFCPYQLRFHYTNRVILLKVVDASQRIVHRFENLKKKLYKCNYDLYSETLIGTDKT